jgi:hypothetical protein
MPVVTAFPSVVDVSQDSTRLRPQPQPPHLLGAPPPTQLPGPALKICRRHIFLTLRRLSRVSRPQTRNKLKSFFPETVFSEKILIALHSVRASASARSGVQSPQWKRHTFSIDLKKMPAFF